MLNNFLYSLNATLPVFAVMVLGWILKKRSFLSDEFVSVANKLTFKVALPCMLFLDIGEMDPAQLLNGKFVLYAAAVSLASILGIWLLTHVFMKDKRQVGAFVQGAYRSSAAVLGVALITNVYGNAGYAPLMILASVPIYNVFAVIILVLEADGGGKLDAARLKRVAVNVVTNPILLGIFAGMPFAFFSIPVPAMVHKGLSMLSNLATPLSLLVIGASFVWGDALKKAKPTVLASLIKLVVLPALFLPLAVKLGFRNEQLMAILIMLGSPSTPSGYIMAKQMGNDDVLANGIVVLTTLLAAVTITLWIFLLRSFALL
ncbi:MAG: AEC family transporter [Clostridia bacterium]|nr:AEC family transporter [Clostridia bacterium]